MVARNARGRAVVGSGCGQSVSSLCAFTAIFAVLCVVSGCVTPPPIKDASAKHASNLAGLQQAVGQYRQELDAYYDRLIQQQRSAHIAWHVNDLVKEIAEDQSASIAKEILSKPNSQKAATDFIEAGAKMADAFVLWGDNFDAWVEKAQGDSLDARRQWLRKEADALEKRSNAATSSIEKIRNAAAQSADQLTYVDVAINLKKQRTALDAELNLLAAQVTTMQAFHAKIDAFLSIDATIDGGKIAAAAAAGSKADAAGIFEKE